MYCILQVSLTGFNLILTFNWSLEIIFELLICWMVNWSIEWLIDWLIESMFRVFDSGLDIAAI